MLVLDGLQIVGGWMLGTCFALIYSCRSTALHQYVVLHNVAARESIAQAMGHGRIGWQDRTAG